MAKMSEDTEREFVKMMYIGDSGSGKTGSLVSLVEAGYKLRILDMDNGTTILRNILREKPNAQELLERVDVEKFRNNYKTSGDGIVVEGRPDAYRNAIKALKEWPDGTKPEEWGEDTVLVIDSMTALGKAAYEWADGLNPTAKDKRQVFFSAQGMLENAVAIVTSENFECHVIIISHIELIEISEGFTKGFPSTVGKALSRKIARWVNCLICASKQGTGNNVRRTITTVPTAELDLKTPLLKVEKTVPLESGLATLFEQIKGTN